ncbi:MULTISPECIES: hypothetical protein [unclassified Xanthomonas]|uniref:hypothetical protein n=1 Tax=Xanthomonas sp. LMG 9002 TaxID=1591158 RepID=UPI00136CCACA|nr:hypothetical protein [Xanthomonas sp. LMG 9002]MXV07589.1 hypothetical protein [Xanthomonas sp. LMG 9002]
MATKKRSTSALRPDRLNPRHLWLAGLGVVALTRKRALAAAADAAQGAATLKALATQLADEAESSVREGAAALRGQVQPLSAEVEARLQPVLVKLGLQAGPQPRKRATSKRGAKQATAKRSAAKHATRPRRAGA